MRKKAIFLTVLLAVSLLFGCVKDSGAGASPAQLQLILAGEREVTVQYLSDYRDPGATAAFGEREAPEIAVEVTGAADTQTLGTYLVKYSAQHGGSTVTAYRRVHVKDLEAPVITLLTDPDRVAASGKGYVEEGYTATDSIDGDLTAQVERTVSKGIVTYKVTDSCGNETVVERDIRHLDSTAPKLTLKGPQKLTILVGQRYVELGYSASDNSDGDITSTVQLDGNIDCNTPGTYTLTYTAADSFGNIATTTRTVSVSDWDPADGPAPFAGKSNGKSIYLTFDDGPSKYTAQLLDVLEKYNIKATFFVVKNGYSGLLPRIAAEGHQLAVHTASHNYKKIYASEEAYFADFYAVRNLIKELTGRTTNLLRFPGGSSNAVSKFNPGIMTRLTAAVREKGYYYFDWNVDSHDASSAKTAAQVFLNVTKGIGKRKTSVVLQHDTKGYSVQAVEMIILWGIENGYTFKVLREGGPGCHHNIRN